MEVVIVTGAETLTVDGTESRSESRPLLSSLSGLSLVTPFLKERAGLRLKDFGM